MSQKEKSDIDSEQLHDERFVEEDLEEQATPPKGGDVSTAKFGEEPTEKIDYAAKVKKATPPKVTALNIKEDLQVLIDADANLSEEFKEKAFVIFEAALNTRIAEEVEALEEAYAEQLSEEVDAVREELIEKVDGYLDYVVQQYMEENQLSITAGLRTEIAENFIESLKSVFVENYVTIPEEKEDLVDELAEQVETLEEQLDEASKINTELHENLQMFVRAEIIREAAQGMTMTDADKLEKLVEELSFEDPEAFARKVNIVKESFIKKDVTTTISEQHEEESDEQISVSPRMSAYMSAISRSINK